MIAVATDPAALVAQIEAAAVALRGYSDDNRSDLGDVLSPSQCRTFLDCSARWWYRYGEGLPDPGGASLVRGRVTHNIAEFYFRSKMEGSAIDGDDLAGAFDWAWESAIVDASFQPDDDLDALKKQTLALSAKYIDEAAREIEPAAVESPVSGEIGGVKVRGIIDLIDVNGRIIDLKTASRKPSGVASDYAFQVATYAQLAAPYVSGEVRVDTLVATKTPQLVTMGYRVSDADRRLTETIYPRVQAAMKAGRILPNRGSNLCSRKHCNFVDACIAEFGGRVKGGDAE
jgi:hypothetical protein